MKRRGLRRVHTWLILPSIVFLAAASNTLGIGRPHYVFLLPDGYVGWVQVISQVRNSPKPIVENGNLLVDMDEGGIFRTPTFHTSFVGAHDEFFYKRSGSDGFIRRVPVPTDYVCRERRGMDSCFEPSEERGADAFTVSRATVGKYGPSSDGSSFFFRWAAVIAG